MALNLETNPATFFEYFLNATPIYINDGSASIMVRRLAVSGSAAVGSNMTSIFYALYPSGTVLFRITVSPTVPLAGAAAFYGECAPNIYVPRGIRIAVNPLGWTAGDVVSAYGSLEILSQEPKKGYIEVMG